MTLGTHVLGGLAVALAFKLPPAPAIFGSILPDFDLKLRLPPPWKRTLFNSHRGITHHVAIPVALLIFSFAVKNFVSYTLYRYFLAFSLGYASHIFLDFLTPLGVPFGVKYYPRLRGNLVRTGKFGEIVVLLILLAFIVFALRYRSAAQLLGM